MIPIFAKGDRVTTIETFDLSTRKEAPDYDDDHQPDAIAPSAA